MSAAVSPDFVLETRGISRALEEFVVAAAWERGGTACAFALGDGTLHIAGRDGGEWRKVTAHDGAALALAPDARPGGFVSGGDDGRFRRVTLAGEVSDIAGFGAKWVEQVASHGDAKTGAKAGLLACGVGKHVHLFDDDGKRLKSLEHPSTVTGLVFDARGKRVAASHYNGATLWFVEAKTDSPRRLEWKGSHIGIVISPDGDAVVTAMQENALHGWRLSDGQHMRMSGYTAKTRAMSFTRNGRYLATSGGDSVVCWPFFGGGPMGKPAIELAGGNGPMCSAVACHLQRDAIAAGYADGRVVLADLQSQRVLPVAAPGRGPISTLAWSPDGSFLALGSETGFAAIVDFSKQ